MATVSESTSEGALEKVLLVDDNPVNLQILFKTLQSYGYKLLIAKDGGSAIDIAIKEQPSLILLDIMMPGMDGFEVCEILKNNPLTESITVIFLSALDDGEAKIKGFAVGGVDYISKPFQTNEVVARVRNHIKIHRLEQQLARRNLELEAENQQILNAIGEGIIGLDESGRITMVNPAATAITGWAATDCLGEQLSTIKLFDVDQVHSLTEAQTPPYRSYHQGEVVHSELELIRCHNHSLLPVALSSAPRAEGGAVVVFRDISESIASEQALRVAREQLDSQRQSIAHFERLSSTSEMAAGIAHEVNQPLTAIANYARVAQRLVAQQPLDGDRLSDLLERLMIQSERASNVIHRLRSYVKKPGAGKTDVDVNAMIAEVIALAEVDSRINDVSIHLEAEPELPLVTVDLVQIQQVALNLIRNAMEAIVEKGALELDVVVTTERNDDLICIAVIDSGVGVRSGEEESLFEPFYSTKQSGMGMGLSICRSIIQAHGGEITYCANPGGGSQFSFTIRVKEN